MLVAGTTYLANKYGSNIIPMGQGSTATNNWCIELTLIAIPSIAIKNDYKRQLVIISV